MARETTWQLCPTPPQCAPQPPTDDADSNTKQLVLGVFRPDFFGVDFSNNGFFSDLPPTIDGKSLKNPLFKKSTQSTNRTLGSYSWIIYSLFVDFLARSRLFLLLLDLLITFYVLNYIL